MESFLASIKQKVIKKRIYRLFKIGTISESKEKKDHSNPKKWFGVYKIRGAGCCGPTENVFNP